MKALDLAKYILVKAEMLDKPISNFQLQQILYIIQKYFLLNDKYAFLEYFYAWRIGPVIPRVYCEFSYHAGCPIKLILQSLLLFCHLCQISKMLLM